MRVVQMCSYFTKPGQEEIILYIIERENWRVVSTTPRWSIHYTRNHHIATYISQRFSHACLGNNFSHFPCERTDKSWFITTPNPNLLLLVIRPGHHWHPPSWSRASISTSAASIDSLWLLPSPRVLRQPCFVLRCDSDADDWLFSLRQLFAAASQTPLNYRTLTSTSGCSSTAGGLEFEIFQVSISFSPHPIFAVFGLLDLFLIFLCYVLGGSLMRRLPILLLIQRCLSQVPYQDYQLPGRHPVHLP
jgi:hypothetical protein